MHGEEEEEERARPMAEQDSLTCRRQEVGVMSKASGRRRGGRGEEKTKVW